MEEVSSGIRAAIVKSAVPVLANIRDEWHWLGPELADLINDNPDVQALPEDVYAECTNGHAHLWLTDQYTVITEFEVDEYTGERDLCLAYAWARERGGRLAPVALDYLEQFARANKCKAITFGTRHQPLIDYLCSDAGFRVSTQILRRDVGENNGLT